MQKPESSGRAAVERLTRDSDGSVQSLLRVAGNLVATGLIQQNMELPYFEKFEDNTWVYSTELFDDAARCNVGVK